MSESTAPSLGDIARQRLPRDLAWVLAVVSVATALLVVWLFGYGYDAHAYWSAWHGSMYTRAPNEQNAFLYSPAVAQLVWPLAVLPWPLFAAVMTVVLLAALVWLLRPLELKWAIPLGIAGLNEVSTGNVYLLMAVAAVIGMSHPAAWAFVALTKVTPCVGPVWFLARLEWRRLLISVGATLAIALVSYLTLPHAWADWVSFLTAHASETRAPLGSAVVPPLVVRAPIGIALVVWGARHGSPWTIPVSMLLCTPVIGIGSFALLYALPRIRRASSDPSKGTPERAPSR